MASGISEKQFYILKKLIATPSDHTEVWRAVFKHKVVLGLGKRSREPAREYRCIKVIQRRKEEKESREFQQALVAQELAAYRALSGPGSRFLVKFHEVVKSTDSYNIVFEYVNGGTLYDLLEERNLLPIAEAKVLMSQIVDGLAVFQSKNLVHRDLKPNNIMLHFGNK